MSEDSISDLVELGLTSLQARVYVALLASGRRPVRQLVEHVGIVRPEVYRVLRELASKGLVQRVPSSPSLYVATPPSQAVSLLVTNFRQRLASLERKNERLVKSLSSVTSNPENGLEYHFSVIRGGANALQQARRLIAEAKLDYSGILSKIGLKRIREDGLATSLIHAKKRGVKVRLITEIDSSNIDCARYISRHVEVRRASKLPFYLDIMDKKKLQMGPAITIEEEVDKSSREMDLWTDNPRFVDGMYMLFDQLWHRCKRFRS